jgi:hypothetical protein
MRVIDRMLRVMLTGVHQLLKLGWFVRRPLGRLTLLRDLLDRVPDTELPLADIAWPPLDAPPAKERYGVLHPIATYRIHGHGHQHLQHHHHDEHRGE